MALGALLRVAGRRARARASRRSSATPPACRRPRSSRPSATRCTRRRSSTATSSRRPACPSTSAYYDGHDPRLLRPRSASSRWPARRMATRARRCARRSHRWIRCRPCPPPPRPPATTRSWSAPASPASTCCTACASSGSRSSCSSRRAASAARGTGTATPARAATSRAWTTRTPSHELEQEWTWTERYAAQPEILRYLDHVADRFDLRRDIRFDDARRGRGVRRGARRWTVTTDGGERLSAALLIMATGCLSVPRMPDIPGLERFAGELLPHRRWPHERRRLHRQARRRDRHRLVGHPVDPADRRAGRAADRVPAHAELQRAGAERARSAPRRAASAKATLRRATAASARTTTAGNPCELARAERRWDATPEEREREFEERWARGGFGLHAAHFNDLLLRHRRRTSTARRVRARQDPRDASTTRRSPSSCAADDHPFGTKRLCVDTDYYETFNRAERHARRHPQRRRSRRSRRAGLRDDGDASTSSTRSCSPPASTR